MIEIDGEYFKKIKHGYLIEWVKNDTDNAYILNEYGFKETYYFE